MPPKVAAVTMAYNELAFLPVWARHYARQVGADHCYVVDHGSTDTVDLPRGVNLLRIPRSAHDDAKRAVFISSLVDSLLEYYDWVLHTDVDEILLADPSKYANIVSFCASAKVDTITAIGLDVQHVPSLEPPLDPLRPLGDQRQWVRFTSAMCKPVLTRRPLIWSPGFHSADTPLRFESLFLFHLHWADRDIGLTRLHKTRAMPWADPVFGAHQRVTDAQWAGIFDSMAAFDRRDDVEFEAASFPLSAWLERTQASAIGREHASYKLDLHINAPELWPIPVHFRSKL